MYNWIVNFLSDRSHHTRFDKILSSPAFINASIVQGSGLGPSAFVLNASDLKPCNTANFFLKYADDTYLVVPASHSYTIPQELDSIKNWATINNLKLNVPKSYEMIVKRPRLAADDPTIPPPATGLNRVTSLKVLGVVFSDRLDFSEHFNEISCKAAKSMFALWVLRKHGLNGKQLWQVCVATTVSHLTYAAPAWWGYTNVSSRQRMQAVVRKLIKYGFLHPDFPSHDQLCEKICNDLFRLVCKNHHHVLHHLLPPIKESQYSMRQRGHGRQIPRVDNNTFRKNFIINQLYKNCY